MRYLAILKDSFREALDAKVMYVLFSLSTVAILAVGTLSFRPLSAKVTMDQFFPDPARKDLVLIFVALYHPEITSAGMDEDDMKAREKAVDQMQQKMQPHYDFRLDKVELLRGEEDSPQSDYVLTVSERVPRFAKKAEEATILAEGMARVRMIFQKAEDMGFLRVADITSAMERKVGDDLQLARTSYRVTLEGTSRTNRIWAHEPSFFFGAFPVEILSAPLSYQLFVLSQNVMSFGAWIAILVGVVITSFFIPTMLAKGTIDMLLVKPIRRWAILLYKYVGGLTFIFLNSLYAMFGMWLMLGLRTGVWAHGLVLLVLTLTFFFAILYAISTLVGVLTRSTIASIIVTIAAWAICFSIGLTHSFFDKRARAEARMQHAAHKDLPDDKRWGDGRLAKASRMLNAITPRTEELNVLNERIAYYSLMTSVLDMPRFETGDRPWWESLLVSGAWTAFFLGLACFWFSYKDY